MRKHHHHKQLFIVAAISVFTLFTGIMLPLQARAHCDTLRGPIAIETQQALASGDVTPLLKWVPPADEDAIRQAFTETLQVRKLSKQAAKLADNYFLETLIRIHRAGEGAPYTGIKSGDDIDHAVLLADQALKDGNIDNLLNILTNAMAKGIRERFQQTRQAAKHVSDSVDTGREYVESYVLFTHYVEGLHTLIKGGSAQHGGGCKASDGGKEGGHEAHGAH